MLELRLQTPEPPPKCTRTKGTGELGPALALGGPRGLEVVQAVGQRQVGLAVDALAHEEGQLVRVLAGRGDADDALWGSTASG